MITQYYRCLASEDKYQQTLQYSDYYVNLKYKWNTVNLKYDQCHHY